MAANVAGNDVQRAGRQAAGSPWFHRLARGGLVAKGVIYLLIGFLAVQIGLGSGGKEADKKGALETVAEKPAGTLVLWLLVIGFAGLALWRFSEALYGQPVPDGDKASKRALSFFRGLFYTSGCITILLFVMGGGASSSNKQSKEWTAKTMDAPGGRWLVLVIGLGFVGWGIGNIVNAVRRKFLKKLKTGQMDPQVRKVVTMLGVIGRSARGLVFGGVGIFLLYAAITFDPNKAKGLDGTLREFTRTPAGPWLLVALAAGLLVYGVYSFCEARWRKVEAVSSGSR